MNTYLLTSTSITIHAALSKVWDALVNPDAIKQYLPGTSVVSTWREGSPIVWKGEWQGRTYADKGVILSLKPGRLLEYSYFSPLSGLADKLQNYGTVSLKLSGLDNLTYVSLVQDNHLTEQARAHAQKIWEMMLAALKNYLEA
ncbi:MAG: SRPBCC domain-containing protein [Candidatus Firestonebacteria bacterium]|nr:SRPBCC domain-containing protein [Candidatus Firestonebacteria bacterium]